MPNTDRSVHPLFRVVVAHPVPVLVVFLVLAAILGWQARNFRIDASADTLLMRGNEHYIQTQVVNQRFAPQEFLLVVYRPQDHALFSDATFDAIRGISDRLRNMERVESVRSLLNVPLFGMIDGGLSAGIEPADWTLEARQFDLNEVQDVLRDHPIYEGLLINAEQSATAIQVLFRGNGQLDSLNKQIVALQKQTLNGGKLTREQERELARLKQRAAPIRRRLDRKRADEVKTVRAMLEDYEDEADIYLGGVHVLGYQLIQIIRNDLVVFGTAIALLICVILLLVFGRLRWVVIPMICCACSVLSTMGIFAMLGLKTTVISSSFIALQLILTLAIVVHLIVQYRQYNQENEDWGQDQLVGATLQRKAAPCFYAGITTSVGFGALLLSRIQPVIDFGWMMVVAMLVSLVVSLFLFSALLALCKAKSAKREHGFSKAILGALAKGSLRYPGAVGLVAVMALVAGLAGALLLDVENSFLNYFRNSTRVHRELSYIDQEFGGSTPLDITYTIAMKNARDELILTAETVQKMQRIQKRLQQHEAVGKVLSVVDFTKLARDLNDGQPLTEYELTSLYWTMEDALREDLVGAFLAPDAQQLRFSIRIQDTTEGLNRRQLLNAIRSDLRDLDIPPDRLMLTNLFVLYQDILQRLFRSQIVTLGVVYAVLTLAFWVIFRSLTVALIAIVPNILSVGIVLGVMGWLGIPLDLMTITIAAVATGIAVDDTIHYVHRFREEDGDADEAIRQTHGSVGYALLYTSVIIILGFCLLAFSNFVPSVLFGLLTGLAMAVALLSDLTVLPVLLRKFASP